MSISENIRDVSHQISVFEEKYDRIPGSVKLLAVSKTHDIDKIRLVHQAGQIDFGENYCQEAGEKVSSLSSLPLVWHFIGPIQSNKTKIIAGNFSWVHSVDRFKIASRLSDQRPHSLPPLKVLIQVNIEDESGKAGCTLKQLPELAYEINALPRLTLAGLMMIPTLNDNFEQQRLIFRRLAMAKNELVQQGLTTCIELSMGMSRDYEAAIAEGATIVRIGTDIFGKR